MVDERVTKLAIWLDNNYFHHKYPHPKVQLSGAAKSFAKAFWSDRERKFSEGALRGSLAEPILGHAINCLIPTGSEYSVEITNLEHDANNGCDVLVREKGGIIGGIDLTISKTSIEEKASRDGGRTRLKKYPVLSLFVSELGSDSLLEALANEEYPDIGEFTKNRLYSPDSKMRDFLEFALIDALPELTQYPDLFRFISIIQKQCTFLKDKLSP